MRQLVSYDYDRRNKRPHKYIVTIDDYFHCLYCNKIEKMNVVAEITSDTELKFVDSQVRNCFTKTCKKCKSDMIIMDEEIFDSVKKLNEKGYKTNFSCEGHKFEIPAYISFTELTPELRKKILTPEHWYWEDGDNVFKFVCLRTLYGLVLPQFFEIKGITFEEHKKAYMDSLNKWIESLPRYEDLKGGESNG